MNQNPNNYTLIKSIPPSDWRAAEEVCYEYQQTREDPDQILHVFEDGSYWYDLQTSTCRTEVIVWDTVVTTPVARYTLFVKETRAKKLQVLCNYRIQPRTAQPFSKSKVAKHLPPRISIADIEKFIELSGAEFLQETGEYSNEPEEFNRLGDYLNSETGIEWQAESSNDIKISATNAKNT